MNCSKSKDLLSAYIDDALTPFEKVELEKHLGSCAGCRQELEELRGTVRLLQSLKELTPPAGFRQGVMAKVAEESSAKGILPFGKSRPLFKRLSGSPQHIAAAAVIIGLGITLGLYQLYFGAEGKNTKIADRTGSSYKQFTAATGRDSEESTSNEKQEGFNTLLAPSEKTFKQPEEQLQNRNRQTFGTKAAEKTKSAAPVQEKSPAVSSVPVPTAKMSQEAAGITAADGVNTPKKALEDQSITDRRIIKEADISLEVNDYKGFSTKLDYEARQYGGYIESRSGGSTVPVSVNLVIRVPVNRFTSLINSIDTMGLITKTEVSGNDVTEEYSNTQDNILSLRTEEQRLMTLINEAAATANVTALEGELGRVRGNIATLQARLGSLEDRASYSTIRLAVTEKK